MGVAAYEFVEGIEDGIADGTACFIEQGELEPAGLVSRSRVICGSASTRRRAHCWAIALSPSGSGDQDGGKGRFVPL